MARLSLFARRRMDMGNLHGWLDMASALASTRRGISGEICSITITTGQCSCERYAQSRLFIAFPINNEGSASSFSLPWLGRHWSWPSMLTLSTESEFDLRGDPLRPTKRPRDPRSSQDSPKPPPRDPETDAASLDTIHQLIQNPALYDPLRTPRYPIVLCHGRHIHHPI